MDRQRFSALAHRDHRFCSPVSVVAVGRLLDATGLPPGARVIDLGAGHGGMAAFVAERLGAAVDAVERSPPMAALARGRAATVRPPARVAVHEADGASFLSGAQPYNLALAVGVDTIFGGGVADTLAGLARAVRPGGLVLFGHTCWRRAPSRAYLAELGVGADAMTDHAGNAAAGAPVGLSLITTAEASEADWDDYEGRYAAGIASHLAGHPDDPDASAMAARIAAHQALYREHGRDALGFGLYLFQRPEPI